MDFSVLVVKEMAFSWSFSSSSRNSSEVGSGAILGGETCHPFIVSVVCFSLMTAFGFLFLAADANSLSCHRVSLTHSGNWGDIHALVCLSSPEICIVIIFAVFFISKGCYKISWFAIISGLSESLYNLPRLLLPMLYPVYPRHHMYPSQDHLCFLLAH